MTRLVFPGQSYSALAAAMLSFPDETCTVLLAEPADERLIVVESYPAPDTAYSRRGPLAASLHPDFLVPIVRAARERGLAVVFVHTHPGDPNRPSFSGMDDEGEVHLADFLARRAPGPLHLAMVISPGGCCARILGGEDEVEVEEVGPAVHWPSQRAATGAGDAWDRQVRAFGADGHERLRRLRVAVVGCGGTGSLVVQQLAHLGVGQLVIIDPDVVETTNLNRVVGATSGDVGRAKVEVAAAWVGRMGLDVQARAVHGDVRDASTARLLTACDALFSCTDSHSSRAVINQIAYQYVIPAFDVGVAIGAEEGRVSYIAGRAQMLAPGLACLVCGNVLDPAAVRREMLSDEARAADPYIVGHNEPQPAVISINSTMASLLVTMFLSAFTGIGAEARLQLYDGLRGRVRPALQRPDPGCIVCSTSGALAKARRWPLPTRP